jgi:peptidoglycan/xylan/chitin deacetylase (PgdA/CDA1 family)
MKINLNSKFILSIRRFVYWCGGNISRFLELKPQLTILCYHSISNDGWRFSTPFEDFKKHVGILMQTYKFISLDEAYSVITGKRKLSHPSVVITFDDGYDDLVLLVPYLKSLGIKPAVFILSTPQKANRTEMGNDKTLLSYEQIKYLQKQGWTIGCHSATHPDLTALTESQLKQEISSSKKQLESVLGKSIKYFAYPKGRYTPQIASIVKSSTYKMAFSMDNATFTASKTDFFAVPRIGIDASHTPSEFQDTLSTISIYLRRVLGKLTLKYEIS